MDLLPGERGAQAGPHPEHIKAAIRSRGTTLRELARRWGYSHAAISVAMRKPWPAIEKRIAKFLGVHPRELWPERYPEGR